MYEAFFDFDCRPFSAAPTASRYFPAAAAEAARTTLARCIERGDGPGLLVGPSGTGKTLVLNVLADQFRDRLRVVLLASGHLRTRRALLQVILFELGLPYRNREEGELRLALIDYLSRSEKCPSGMLLLIDEAHTLPIRLLEEIRMITNLVKNGQPRVHLILAGGPLLEERFASPKLDSLSQRLAARCYLDSFGRAETADYVRHQAAAAGGNAEGTFGQDALDAVYQASDGIPRLINQVCDHALMLAYADGRRPLDARAIDAAWADLQQLPSPWRGAAPAFEDMQPTMDRVIEFGDLDDDFKAGPVESTLAATDDDLTPSEHAEALDSFTPAGTIGGEVELLDDDAQSMPLEAFDDEEVLVDQYAMIESGADSSLDAWADSGVLSEDSADYLQIAKPVESIGEIEEEALASEGDEHEELVRDPYAAIDAREERRRNGGCASGTATDDWLDGLQQVTQRSPEATLTLAEALLLHEMSEPVRAAEPPVQAPTVDDAASTLDYATQPVDEGTHPVYEAEHPRDEETQPVNEAMQLVDETEAMQPVEEATQIESSAADDGMQTESEPAVDDYPVAEHDGPNDLATLDAPMLPRVFDPSEQPAARIAEDSDLIIVDHEITVELLTAEQPTAQVQKRDYRQLFANLRRGTQKQ